MARIALVNAPFYSHVTAMSRLAQVLVRQGHELVVWAPEESRGQFEPYGAAVEQQEVEIPRVRGFGFAARMAEITEQSAEPLISQLHEHNIELLIRDSQTPWAQVAAGYLGIPSIVSHPMFPVVAREATFSMPGQTLPDPTAEQEAKKQFEEGWLSIARRWGVEIEDINGVFHSTAEPTLVFTTEEIVGDYELRAGWSCVGPLLSPPPPAEPRGDVPLVYVCFGTSWNFRRELFEVVIDALGGEACEVVVSTGGGPMSAPAFEPLPANVEIQQFASSRELLSQAALHITHGGCNSVHESLMAGVPMVCLPQAFDQLPLAERVEQLGAGLLMSETAQSIRDASRLLLSSDKVRSRTEELSRHLVEYDGEARVVAVVERVLEASALSG